MSSISFGQNYINGTVGLFGPNLSNGTTVASGGALFFNSNTLYETGNFTNLGGPVAISANTGTLEFSGTTAQQATGIFTIGGIRVSKAGATPAEKTISVTNTVPSSMISVLDVVSFGNASGAVLAANGYITLKSFAAKTARVADVTNSSLNAGNTITGDVIVERYIPSKRAWRLLAPPTSGGQTINAAWQEGATWTSGPAINPAPGYGTVISKPAGASAAGYDAGVKNSKAYSLRMYTSSGLLTQPATTSCTSFVNNAAYLLEIRGDRTVLPEDQTTTTTSATETTLRTKGNLYIGTQIRNIDKTAGNLAGVGNPYASTIDFSLVQRSAAITNGFFVWDTKMAGLGGWVYIDGADNYVATVNQSYNNAYKATRQC